VMPRGEKKRKKTRRIKGKREYILIHPKIPPALHRRRKRKKGRKGPRTKESGDKAFFAPIRREISPDYIRTGKGKGKRRVKGRPPYSQKKTELYRYLQERGKKDKGLCKKTRIRRLQRRKGKGVVFELHEGKKKKKTRENPRGRGLPAWPKSNRQCRGGHGGKKKKQIAHGRKRVVRKSISKEKKRGASLQGEKRSSFNSMPKRGEYTPAITSKQEKRKGEGTRKKGPKFSGYVGKSPRRGTERRTAGGSQPSSALEKNQKTLSLPKRGGGPQ